MKSIQTSILSNKKYSFNILDSIKVEVSVEKNDFHIPPETLFKMAARINKKRSFLFVSKVLGKHLPIHPNRGLLTSALLAAKYYEEVKGGRCELKNEWLSAFSKSEPFFSGSAFIQKTFDPLIIGFAETATALGHAFFDCFEGADYVHTTREVLQDQPPVISFEEEHSHATSHRCYLPLQMVANEREIILVDDELTTGKTALNIIRSIQSRFPRKEYSVVSILDWRSEEDKQEFKKLEHILGITIHVVSLIAGKVQVNIQNEKLEQRGEDFPCQKKKAQIEKIYLPSLFEEAKISTISTNGSENNTPFLYETGRFGISSDVNWQTQRKTLEAASFLTSKRSGRNALCLGTGEFMYLPMKIAAEMGPGISYQSTTRSPIFVKNETGYGAEYGLAFSNPEDPDIDHFVYNIPPGFYDELFLFLEREVDNEQLFPLLKELEKTQIESIKIVCFMRKKG
jgi:hypothetical protein